MAGVPYVFASATTSIPLSQLDADFNTPVTIGNTTVGLGNTVTSFGNVTLTNTTITVGNVTTDLTVHGLTVGQGGGSVSTNTAVGTNALAGNSSGVQNVAIGYGAINSASGNNNVALGYNALNVNTGSSNVGIGFNSLISNTSGGSNVGIGQQALQASTTASNNTAVGYQAGYYTTTGGGNIFVGQNAGAASGVGITTGTSNIVIGASASASSASDSQSITILASNSGGNGKGSSTGFINPNGGGVYQGNNSTLWTVTSDQRLKKNIVDNTIGLTAINGIKVRNFEYRLPEEVTELDQHCAVAITGVQLGPIAQELQQVLPDCVKTESTGVMSVDSSDVLWHLVNAVQQLSAQVTALQAKVGA